MDQRQIVERIVREVINQAEPRLIPVAVSARHAHVSKEHIQILFGRGYELKPRNPLSQPGQFAAEETVNIIGPRRCITGVRILGPARSSTQVELSVTDGISLGLKLHVRDSGDIAGSHGLTLAGPEGCVHIPEGVIAARRHLHLSTDDASRLKLTDKQVISVRARTKRPATLEDILVRVSGDFSMELHLDTDEANACMLKNGDMVEIV